MLLVWENVQSIVVVAMTDRQNRSGQDFLFNYNRSRRYLLSQLLSDKQSRYKIETRINLEKKIETTQFFSVHPLHSPLAQPP